MIDANVDYLIILLNYWKRVDIADRAPPHFAYVQSVLAYCRLAYFYWRWFPPGTPVSSASETDISSPSPPRYDPGCC